MPADIAPAFQLASSLRSVRTLSLDEAAAFLHMHPEEVRTRAKRGLIPGAKAGRRWIFLEIDLVEFVRSLYPDALQELGGWETERMVRRYAHLAADHLAVYVGNAQIQGTFLAHPPTLPKPLDETILEDQ
jgi:Helix-turn-helix domain